jgi:hypothetical protein
MAHLAALFQSIDWPRLRPAPELLPDQPGHTTPSRYIAAARTEAGDLALLYTPQDRQLRLDLSALQPNLIATWFNPRTGQRTPASGPTFETPAPGDWLLILEG